MIDVLCAALYTRCGEAEKEMAWGHQEEEHQALWKPCPTCVVYVFVYIRVVVYMLVCARDADGRE